MESKHEKSAVSDAEGISATSTTDRGLEDVEGHGGDDIVEVKLDKHGLPLIPQPSAHKDDPLNWSPLLKLFVTLQISWLACLGPLSSATSNPAFATIGKAFDISTVEASYILTIYLLFGGIAPLFVAPFANIYGRRPVYLLGNLLAGIMNIVAGNCNTWAGILVTRAFTGIGGGACVAIGAATICDLYFMHERGVYMGVYTFFLTNGPHVAPLIGGYIAQGLGWRYCFSIPGYMQLGTFAITLFCLPETLYSRRTTSQKPKSYVHLLTFKRPLSKNHRLHANDFLKPFYMLRYIPIVLSGLYYMTCFGYGTVLFGATGASLFGRLYDFDVEQTGLILSIPLLVGCLIGEFNAGWVTDWMVYRYARKHDGERKPEARLDGIWLALLLPVGVIVVGVCFTHYKTVHWIGPAFGMGTACLGLQVATTVVYSYSTDCYKPQSAEVSVVLNTFRQIFAALISFYAIPLGDMIRIEYAWLVFALINVLFLLPMFALRIFGSKWRAQAWQSPPQFHNDI